MEELLKEAKKLGIKVIENNGGLCKRIEGGEVHDVKE